VKTLLIILAVVAGLTVLGWLRYLLMGKSKKAFLKQQIKALPYMLPRYFV